VPEFWGGLVGGAVIGAVFGLLVTVLFEEYLVTQRKRVTRRVAGKAKALRGTRSPAAPELFSLGPLRTSVLIVEGDGQQVINEQAITIHVDPTGVSLPAELQDWREEFLQEQQRLADAGENFFWNGPCYAVSGFSVSRTLLDEEPEIALRLRYSDYATFKATQQLDRAFADGSTPRSRYLAPFAGSPLQVPDFMSSSFGTNIAMITADGKFLFARRSGLVGSRPDVWSTSANEALSRGLDSKGRDEPNLYDVMRRGVREELGIMPDEYELELLAFHLDLELHQWGAAWIGVLRELTGDDILQRRSRGVADKYENHELKLVGADPEATLEFLLDEGLRGSMAPHTAPVYYLALVRYHNRRTVERALARVQRRYPARKSG
jgi:hypothetical protein